MTSLPIPLALTAVIAAAPVFAQETTPTPDVLAQIKDGEKARLDLQSIKKFGDTQGQFDVIVVWDETDRPKPADYLPRRVRYMANCEEGTMTVSAIGMFDRNGQIAKTIVAPPRSLDPIKPVKGSDEAKWIRQVCMF
ncbi:MAG TPA: surface-adhesin E family protein [Burkholderiales bacterium]|nr:surface-adhesin E family protein [Burkholderiales bacterium]